MRDADAKRLARSPYTLADFRVILTEEVHPACVANLLSLAGEWAGFDEHWLERRILAGGRGVLCLPAWLSPLKRAVRDQAEALFARADDIRGAQPHPSS